MRILYIVYSVGHYLTLGRVEQMVSNQISWLIILRFSLHKILSFDIFSCDHIMIAIISMLQSDKAFIIHIFISEHCEIRRSSDIDVTNAGENLYHNWWPWGKYLKNRYLICNICSTRLEVGELFLSKYYNDRSYHIWCNLKCVYSFNCL